VFARKAGGGKPVTKKETRQQKNWGESKRDSPGTTWGWECGIWGAETGGVFDISGNRNKAKGSKRAGGQKAVQFTREKQCDAHIRKEEVTSNRQK